MCDRKTDRIYAEIVLNLQDATPFIPAKSFQ